MMQSTQYSYIGYNNIIILPLFTKIIAANHLSFIYKLSVAVFMKLNSIFILVASY